jgi:predicted DNA-binding transcriptional regulator AlpA
LEQRPDDRIDVREVSRITGISVTEIYEQQKLGNFPTGYRYSAKCVRWTRSTVQAWLDSNPTLKRRPRSTDERVAA